MPETLASLEAERRSLLQRFGELGDFRPGSITATSGRCGNPHCHCHRAGEAGHGPNLRLTYKRDGKTITETFPTSGRATQGGARGGRIPPVSATEPHLRRGQCRDLPSATGGRRRGADGGGKKTAEVIQQEVAREVETLLAVYFAARRKSEKVDLEALEMATRAALQRAGAEVVEELLALPEAFPPQVPCACGHSARYQERRRKQLVTVLGRVETERPYYLCPHCHHGQSPRDQELQVEGVQYSPGVQRMMAAVGSETSFERGRQQLELLAGVKVTTKAIERQAEAIGAEIAAQEQAEIRQGVQLELPQVPGPQIPVLYIEMDATGVPVVASETEGRPGKEGEQARTRDAKLGCVFTQTT